MNPIIIPIAELKPALTGLSKVVDPKSPLPALKCIKLERTTEGWIALTTSNQSQFITLRLEQPAPGKPACMLVPFDALADLTKNANRGDSLEIIHHPDHHTITVSRNTGASASSSPIKSPPIAEFPQIPKMASEPIPLPPEVRHSIHEAMACTSDDPTRMILRGAFIDVSQPKTHYVVSTDGRHLYSSNSFHLPTKSSVLIPKHKFLGWREFNNDGEWQLKDSPEWLQLSSRRWRFITRHLHGTYPRWRAVLPDPQQAKIHLTIAPETLESLVQTIEKLPCHDDGYHTIGLEWKDKRLHLLCKADPDDPWTGEPVTVSKAEGKEITVFLDRQFLTKGLKFGLNTISLIDEMSPLRFHNEKKQMIVMPLRGDQIQRQRNAPAPVHKPRVPQPSPPPMTPSSNPRTASCSASCPWRGTRTSWPSRPACRGCAPLTWHRRPSWPR